VLRESSLGAVSKQSEATSRDVANLNISISLADLLSSLESGMGSAAGASDRLRSQVHRMDGYMQAQRQQHVTLTGQPPHSQTGERHSILPSNNNHASHPSDNANMLGPHANASNSNHNQDYYHTQDQHAPPGQDVALHGQGNIQNPDSFYSFPAEIFEDWNWAFDFTQTSR
jgi:hypothetical protein